MIYCKGEFTDVNGTDWTINIYKEGYTGEVKLLLLGDSPLVIEYVGDNPFKPVKYSGCSIKVLTPTILAELYTGKILDVKIEILKGNELYWIGYNSPNIYNQEYWSNLDETTIEGLDCLSATQYFKWDGSVIANSTFLQQVRTVFNKVYQNQPDIYYFNEIGGLTDFKCVTNNWTNEDDDNDKLNEVLEDICTFLGVQMFQYKDLIWIVGNNRGNGIIYKADNTTQDVSHNFTPKMLEVAENTSNISYGDTYNQISVIGNVIDLDEDILNFNSSDNEHLYMLNDYCWRNKMCKTNEPEYVELFTTYGLRDDCTMGRTPTYNTNINYPKLTLETKVSFERWANIRFDADYFTNDNTPSLTFTNNLVFYPRLVTYVPYTNSGYYSALLIMDTTLIGQNESILHYVSKPRLFKQGDYIMVNLNLYYTSEYGSGIDLNEGVDNEQSDHINMKPVKAIIYNNFVTGLVPFGVRFKIKLGDKYLSKNHTGEMWTTTEAYADFVGQRVKNGTDANSSFLLANTNNYDDKVSSELEGYAIEIPETFFGTLEFDVISAVARPCNKRETEALVQLGFIGSGSKSQISNGVSYTECNALLDFVHILDLSLKYVPKVNKKFWELDNNQEDKDLRYEAEIAEDNVNDFNDLTLNLNTYNPTIYEKLSDSYVLDQDNKFVSRVLGGAYYCRPEQHLVRKYVDYYKDPKRIYTNTYKLIDNLLPYDYFTTSYLGNPYLVGDATIDAKYNTINIEGYEV